ncbi:MAG: 5'-nucleotidase C-terminal domain-containing protein [Bacteroidales bacterium]|nr:5'-nucleotidase C-terminal domain-containing protein [Candidatus Liminaster caballi]
MNIRAIISHVLAVMTLVIGTGCALRSEADISLLYLTDVHGLLLQDDFNEGHQASSSLAKFCSYRKIALMDDPERFILLCGGDLNVDQPSLYYYNNFVKYEEHISPRVMNWLGFDAIQMGANDMISGMKIYHDLLPKQYRMPYLCANAIDDKTGKCAFVPYTVIERKGVKVAVLGMMDPRIRSGIRHSYYDGIHFMPVEECARMWIDKIRTNERPDIIVGLLHTDAKNSNVLNVPGFDVILLGFDHNSLPAGEFTVNEVGDTVYLVEPMHHVQEVARVDIQMKRENGAWKKKDVQVQRISLQGYPADLDFCAEFKQSTDDINKYLSTPIGNFENPIPASDALFGPSVIMDLIHNMQLWVTKADVSFTSLSSSLDGIRSGTFTMRDVFQLYRYDNKLMMLRMTGAEINTFLEHAYDVQFNMMKNADDHLIAFRYDENNEIINGQYGPELVVPHYAYTSAAGIKYTVDVSKPNGQKVNIISMSDGRPFDVNAEYRVAINDYQAAGGGSHTTDGLGWDANTADERRIFIGDMDMRMYIVNYIRMHKDEPVCRNDWKVIPATWWNRGFTRDYNLMKPMFEPKR